MSDFAKKLENIGREEGRVFDVGREELDAEKAEEKRKRELDGYFMATKVMRPFEDPIGYFKRTIDRAVDRVVGWFYSGERKI